MKLHANARLSLKGRELLVDRMLTHGSSLAQAAEAAESNLNLPLTHFVHRALTRPRRPRLCPVFSG